MPSVEKVCRCGNFDFRNSNHFFHCSYAKITKKKLGDFSECHLFDGTTVSHRKHVSTFLCLKKKIFFPKKKPKNQKKNFVVNREKAVVRWVFVCFLGLISHDFVLFFALFRQYLHTFSAPKIAIFAGKIGGKCLKIRVENNGKSRNKPEKWTGKQGNLSIIHVVDAAKKGTKLSFATDNLWVCRV